MRNNGGEQGGNIGSNRHVNRIPGVVGLNAGYAGKNSHAAQLAVIHVGTVLRPGISGIGRVQRAALAEGALVDFHDRCHCRRIVGLADFLTGIQIAIHSKARATVDVAFDYLIELITDLPSQKPNTQLIRLPLGALFKIGP